MSDALEISVENHVAHVRLNRPDAHNAINGPIMEALQDISAGGAPAPGQLFPRQIPPSHHFGVQS